VQQLLAICWQGDLSLKPQTATRGVINLQTETSPPPATCLSCLFPIFLRLLRAPSIHRLKPGPSIPATVGKRVRTRRHHCGFERLRSGTRPRWRTISMVSRRAAEVVQVAEEALGSHMKSGGHGYTVNVMRRWRQAATADTFHCFALPHMLCLAWQLELSRECPAWPTIAAMSETN
jgi:hypothetical protein